MDQLLLLVLLSPPVLSYGLQHPTCRTPCCLISQGTGCSYTTCNVWRCVFHAGVRMPMQQVQL